MEEPSGRREVKADPNALAYPFAPKSNRFLYPGQFWGIPLSDGRFACGRVLQIDAELSTHGRRTAFLAGLMDWCGDAPPTASAIAGARVRDQGIAHLKTVTENGGVILGYRPLEVEGIEPLLCVSGYGFGGYPGGMLLKGLMPLRPATAEDRAQYSILSSWGYKVISVLAEQYCAKRDLTDND